MLNIFGTLVENDKVSCEKQEPSALHTLEAFWLDFEGRGPPGGGGLA